MQLNNQYNKKQTGKIKKNKIKILSDNHLPFW